MIYLDTHVVAWLYAGEAERFTTAGRRMLERDELLISPIVQLELQYLHETGRLAVDSSLVFDSLAASIGLRACDAPFADVVRESLAQSWTRDPFDRIIVAQAQLRAAPLLTKDRSIRKRYVHAVW